MTAAASKSIELFYSPFFFIKKLTQIGLNDEVHKFTVANCQRNKRKNDYPMNLNNLNNFDSKEALNRAATVQGTRHISFKRPRVDDDRANPSANENDPFTSVYGACPNVSLRYKKVSRIGEGTYGIVYKAIDQKTSEYVALKRCLPHHEATDGFPITTLREVQILREISMEVGDLEDEDEKNGNQYIVALKDIAVGSKPSSVFLIFEHVDFELAKLVDHHFARYSKSPFSLGEVKRLSIQLLSAVAFIHDRCIIHRDIKLSNLLYHQGTLKLCDFGLARRTSEIGNGKHHTRECSIDNSPEDALTPKVVSLWYRPIELLLGAQNYDISIDCWACGCVIAELILGQPLFRGRNELDQLQKIIDLMGIPRIERWPGLQSLIERKCFNFDGSSEDISFDMESVKGKYSCSTLSCAKLLDKFGDLSAIGIELLFGLLNYDPYQRWSASKAKSCAFFQENPKPVHIKFMPKFQSR
jgi:serine/threonine protein kinase